MILLDADVLLIDLRYPNDVRFATNRRLLDHLKTTAVPVGMTAQAMLEVVGVLSFNVAAAKVPRLPELIALQYALEIVPDPALHPGYAGLLFDEIVSQMARKSALGDAVQALQIEKHCPAATCLLSWNAKHFVGKLSVPVLTPDDWLAQQTPAAP